jgi:hypothetical protein
MIFNIFHGGGAYLSLAPYMGALALKRKVNNFSTLAKKNFYNNHNFTDLLTREVKKKTQGLDLRSKIISTITHTRSYFVDL